MPARPRLLTTSQLARELGLSERTIQRYRAERVLVPTLESPGGHARWDVDAVRQKLRELAEHRNADRD